MDSTLSIADSSLNADRTALAVTSENIANVNTPGYVSESADLETAPGGESGAGGGVLVATISQARNALLTANNNQAQGALSSLSTAQQLLTSLQAVFPLGQGANGSSSSAGNTSLSGQLASF